MQRARFRAAAILAAVCLAGVSAAPAAAGSVTWTFDESTDGEDLLWTSPTAVDPTAPRYDLAYELTTVEVTVFWLFLTFDVDVTDEVPPEQRSGSGIVDGPPPIEFFSGSIAFPLPPEEPALAGDLDLLIDETGHGQLAFTNIVFGELQVEVPGFGLQTVELRGIRLAGQLTVTPLGPAEDINADGVVNFEDLLLLLGAWGACPPPPDACPADVDGDGMVGFSDLLRVLAAWS